MEDPKNGWFIMENQIKMHDLGAPPILVQYMFISTVYVQNGDLQAVEKRTQNAPIATKPFASLLG